MERKGFAKKDDCSLRDTKEAVRLFSKKTSRAMWIKIPEVKVFLH